MNNHFIVLHHHGGAFIVNVNNIAYIEGCWIYFTGIMEGSTYSPKEMSIDFDESLEEVVELINKATGQNISLK